ncbi:16S rRNA (cytidine(1402)-2'-O)-methyltransferase [Helicobacter suis]|uniref:16S rRNA (cytidine(1402)-2'-O)-methyltransferase n=1 Tax=Helicobacter suis TaxID=104628 RepID=UPI0013D6C926|nr:16S rRNA (cytidine(1402)-2'-O)-methyltransferase [Helicobacter suis]
MLTLLPTPIGNLKDMTMRALEALANCDVCLCEDVRITKRLVFLLKQQDWTAPLKSTQPKRFLPFHSHNQEAFLNQVDPSFFASQHVVFVSDAGCPCVSDPGAKLVAFAQEHGIVYDVLPGASACINAYSASGFQSPSFYFVGFLPPKSLNRRAVLTKLRGVAPLLVFYESPKRLLDMLADLKEIFSDAKVFAIKEMTKLNQQHYKEEISALYDKLKGASAKALQGEWVLVVESQVNQEPSLSAIEIERMDLPPKIKVKLLARLMQISPKELYTRTYKNP